MRTMLLLCPIFILMAGSRGAKDGNAVNDACDFSLQGSNVKATVTQPEGFDSLGYVVEQPDSPLELLSVDLSGMKISTSSDRYESSDCARIKVRNRSDRAVRRFELSLEFNAGGGFGTNRPSSLSGGQTADIDVCNTGGSGRPIPAPFHLLVSVARVEFAGCVYRPSMRIPDTLAVQSPW